MPEDWTGPIVISAPMAAVPSRVMECCPNLIWRTVISKRLYLPGDCAWDTLELDFSTCCLALLSASSPKRVRSDCDRLTRQGAEQHAAWEPTDKPGKTANNLNRAA